MAGGSGLPKLVARFGTRSKLWAEVVHALGERLFVETELHFKVGSKVEVSVAAPSLAGPLALEGTVIELRAGTEADKPGVFVRLAETSVAKCRDALNVPRNETVRTTGRSEARVEGQMPARMTAPEMLDGCVVRGFSQNGLTFKTPRAFPQGTKVDLVVKLGDEEITLSGTVTWSRAELGLSGLQLSGLPAGLAERLVKALSAGQPTTVPMVSTVVVADDDAEIVELVSKVVTGAGHRVLSASRGDDALDLIRKERPSLVFLDILMPGLDGLEVCKVLRADAVLSRVAVVLLSAMSEQRLEEVGRAVGATGWLTKPMRIAGVRAMLEKYLR